jgi:hypothetical protein
MPKLPKTKKPTVGFPARFFWKGQNSRKVLSDNNLQTQKPPKHVKARNKMLFSWRERAILLPKRRKNGPFLLSVRFLRRGQGRF